MNINGAFADVDSKAWTSHVPPVEHYRFNRSTATLQGKVEKGSTFMTILFPVETISESQYTT